MLEFITSNLRDSIDAEKGEGIGVLLKGTLTSYVPVYMGNNMLFWAGQFWERSHDIPSNRMRSKDLTNANLELGLKRLLVKETIDSG